MRLVCKIKVASTGELDDLPVCHNNIDHNYCGSLVV
jgi:hypothetical protein